MEIKIGQIYKHFKGNYYVIENIAYDCESNENEELKKVVIYRALYGDHKLWVRKYDDFVGYKIKDNEKIKRFLLIEPKFINIIDRNI